MICSKAKSLMGPYVFGDTSAEEARIVRTHTEQCSKCREDLNERMAISTLMDDTIPELSEDEISRIKWYVKGAVSDCSKPRQSTFRRLLPAFSMMLFLALGFAFGRWIGIEHHMNANQSVLAPLPTITIQDNSNQRVGNKKENTASMPNKAEKTAASSDTDNSGTVSPTSQDYFRFLTNATRDMSSLGLATDRKGRSGKRHRVIILDQPLPLASEPGANNSEVRPDENKLPVPTTLNNMEKTEPKPSN